MVMPLDGGGTTTTRTTVRLQGSLCGLHMGYIWSSDVSTSQYGISMLCLPHKLELDSSRQGGCFVIDRSARSATLTAERGGKTMSSFTRSVNLETVQQSSCSSVLSTPSKQNCEFSQSTSALIDFKRSQSRTMSAPQLPTTTHTATKPRFLTEMQSVLLRRGWTRSPLPVRSNYPSGSGVRTFFRRRRTSSDIHYLATPVSTSAVKD